MEAEELLERYATGERDFTGVDLSGVNLAGAYLKLTNLSETSFEGANLTNCCFKKAWKFDKFTWSQAILCNTIMPDGSIRNDYCK